MSDHQLRDGQHFIGYAYPSSVIADAVGHPNGCHYYTRGTKGSITVFATYEATLQHALTQGTEPSRWSKDHPLNAKFLSRSGVPA